MLDWILNASLLLVKNKETNYTKKLKLYGPCLWMGLNCLKAIEPLQRRQFHLINFDGMNSWNNLDFKATQQIWTQDAGLWIQYLNH